MRRKYSLRKLEQLMKEENNESLSYRDAKRWSKQQEQKQERCKSCHSNNVPCEKYLVACSSPTCRYSGERCSREDDELYDRICQGWRRVKRTHFDEIAKKLPKSHCEDGLIVGKSGKTTKLLTPWSKSHLDLEDDEDDDEEEEKSDHDNGFQSEETAVYTMTGDDDGKRERETVSYKAPSKRKRRRDSDDDSEYEGNPPSRKELQAAILSLKDKEKQSAEELRKLKIEKQSSDHRQKKSQSTISKLEADIEKIKRNYAASKEQDRTLIHKWEKQAKEASATLDELRREHAKLQEAYAHDKNETEPGSSTSRHVSQAPREENMAKQDMLMQQDAVPMPSPTDIHSDLQEEIRTLKEKQEADAVTEAELRQTLHRTEKTSALKEDGLKREIQALNASREASIATETELRQEVRALIATQEAMRELMTRQEASTAARETELRQELQSLREGVESANVAERNLLSKLVKVKEDQQRQSKDEHYELSTVLQSLRRGIPRPDLAGVVQMQIPIIERLVDRRVLLNLPEMDTSD